MRESSETLARRIRFVELGGFALDEVGPSSWRRLWLRGGFPRSFLAHTDTDSLGWREDFVRTFIERDLTTLGVEVRSRPQLRRLWSMLAHRHGQLWNGAEPAGALGAALQPLPYGAAFVGDSLRRRAAWHCPSCQTTFGASSVGSSQPETHLWPTQRPIETQQEGSAPGAGRASTVGRTRRARSAARWMPDAERPRPATTARSASRRPAWCRPSRGRWAAQAAARLPPKASMGDWLGCSARSLDRGRGSEDVSCSRRSVG